MTEQLAGIARIPRRRGLHGQLVAELGQLLVDGVLAEGDLLVPETIGEQFGVSRTVVRESLRVLEAKGMVSARPNVGTKIRPVADWNLLDPDVIVWRARSAGHADQMRELLELRTALEPFAARLAARHADPERIARLRAAEKAMFEAVHAGDIPAFTRADLDFHAELLAASHNRIFDKLNATVAASLRVREDLLVQADHLSEEAVELHSKVLAAIEARDEAAADAKMRTLLEEVTHEIDEQLAASDRGAA